MTRIKIFFFIHAAVLIFGILSPASWAQENLPPVMSAPIKPLSDISEEAIKTEPLLIKKANGRAEIFQVETASTPEDRAKGLMNRQSMPKSQGMIFLFQDESLRHFWMKNTLIPLDMIFIGRDGKILSIHHNAVPHDETPISSEYPIVAVLEINGGVSKELEISVGDTVVHKGIGNGLAP